MNTLPLFDSTPSVDREPPLRPGRSYVSDILSLRTAPERRAALAAITDPKTRALVRFYVEDYFARRSGRALPDLSRIEAEEASNTQEETACKPNHL